MVVDGTIVETPTGSDPKEFILEMARRFDAIVITNDKYRDYQIGFSDVLERLVQYTLIFDEIVIPRCHLPVQLSGLDLLFSQQSSLCDEGEEGLGSLFT